MKTTPTAFWNHTPADRNAARAHLMAAGAGFGDSIPGGIAVPIMRGNADDVNAAAATVGLREIGRYYTTTKGRTVLMLELAA